MLSLSQDFLIKSQQTIDGIEDSIARAEALVNDIGVPICDFSRFRKGENKK